MKRLIVELALRELETRAKLAEACFGVARAVGRVGSRIAGSGYVDLAVAAPQGATQVVLPRVVRLARGLRLELKESVEIVRILKVQGQIVTIDRPLAQAYPQGAKVKVLV